MCCCSLCHLGKVRLPSSGPGGSDRDARGPRDKNGGSGAGNPPAAAGGSDMGSRGSGGSKQQDGLPPAPGSLAAAAAAAGGGSGGSLRSLGQQAAEKLSQAASGAKGGSLMGGEGAPLTKGVKAHAVMLSQSALSVNNM
jgi:hypothetical protein